jgi:PIN domain nuclease of toxin-antitoxin system
MKSYILDTHIFLNAYIKPEKIRGEVLKIIEKENH